MGAKYSTADRHATHHQAAKADDIRHAGERDSSGHAEAEVFKVTLQTRSARTTFGEKAAGGTGKWRPLPTDRAVRVLDEALQGEHAVVSLHDDIAGKDTVALHQFLGVAVSQLRAMTPPPHAHTQNNKQATKNSTREVPLVVPFPWRHMQRAHAHPAPFRRRNALALIAKVVTECGTTTQVDSLRG